MAPARFTLIASLLAAVPAAADPDRRPEAVFTEPWCDVCSAEDKSWLQARSPIVRRVVALVDGARASIDAAQFTFSVREIEAALLRAHQRGVKVRLVIDAGQRADSASTRLEAAGVPVRFVAGRPARGNQPAGLQHAKFLLVDGVTLASGSNNWSSTGTSINEEATLVFQSTAADPLADPLIGGFHCHFEAMWAGRIDDAGRCSRPGVAFSPGTAPIALIKGELRAARRSIDVAMHHLLFEDFVKELANAAQRGVAVRVLVNAADQEEAKGAAWDRLLKAGGAVRFKRTNAAAFQIMHHKLVIIDGKVLVNGSGNWSGSAFFNNYENYVRYDDARLVSPFVALYERLWSWSLTRASLAAGLDPARQHMAQHKVYFGNLHAHIASGGSPRPGDDGKALRKNEAGVEVPVPEAGGADAALWAWRYARDVGKMDFLALTPHTADDLPTDPPDVPSIPASAYKQLRAGAATVTGESAGRFLALAGMEWSTNTTGNHVTVLGAAEVCKVARGRFDRFWDGWLPERRAAGDRVVVQLAHPKTFPEHQVAGLPGSWDQIFGHKLTEIQNAAERKQKFNDYGLDDYPPLSTALPAWVAGEVEPDPRVVAQSLGALQAASRPYARLIEVTLGRGTELGADKPVNPDLVPREGAGLARETRVDDWEYYLLAGFHLAPAGNHDNHYANFGTGHTTRTGVFAAALTERDVLEAIERGQVFATEDANLSVRVYVESLVPMGGTLRTRASSVRLQIEAKDPDYTAPLEIRTRRGKIGGARFEAVERRAAPAGVVEVVMPLPEAGTWVIYVEVAETGVDRLAWSAPIWVERLE